jgi:hypothetical protein
MNIEKLKSRKFILILIWQLFIIISFINCFFAKRILEYFDTLMYVCSVLSASYIGVQGDNL